MLPTFLATDLPMPSEDIASLIFFAKWIGAAVSLLGTAYLIISIWSMTRRQPPNDQVFATKTEMTGMMTTFQKQLELSAAERDKAMELLRAEIGKFEHERRDATHTLHEQIRQMASTLSQNLQDVSRQIGVLEGKNDAVKFIIDSIKSNHTPSGRHS